jgi:uncharacterized tellurite resistance protein B-like protein
MNSFMNPPFLPNPYVCNNCYIIDKMTLKNVFKISVFNKLFKTSSSNFSYSPRSEQEAWIAIMYACMYIDGNIALSEIKKMFQLVEKHPLFTKKQVADYYQPAMLGHRKIGSYALIDTSTPLVAENNKPELFSMIMELLLADGILGNKEKKIARYLTESFNLEVIQVKKIISEMLGKR